MRTSTRLPPWARRDVVGYIFDAAKKRGGEARIVGGAVRDWLAGRRVGDIDMAVNLPIRVMADELRQHQLIKVINTGLSHGTVTIVCGSDAVELTQTRSDDDTDGRHAVVRFQDDWAQDAARRDFTINAVYLDGLLAKLSRPVYYDLAARAEAGDDGRIGVWSHDHFFILE